VKILALETSAVAASVCVCEDEELVAQSFQRTGLTHSATLMPMAEALLKNAGLTLEEMDVIAVAAGPGSFTGLRIGISAAKGLAWPGDKPCAGVSTLEAMAWQLIGMEGVVCAAMDARRSQVYNALFELRDGVPVRIAPDRAISLEELGGELAEIKKPQILVGDGAHLCYNAFQELGYPVRMAPPHLRFQTAWGVARAALEQARQGQLTDAAGLTPSSHRLSQAERERLAKRPERGS
jgi:tRNA threonylcarbamoyladenosine biosynthesis protein TsaB